ncbi:pyridoxamine 5'-phosphate oxidase family protein [Falsiroseomonas sp. E2-1-a20]|uniref:pyridoxamine 5'-phosphate oxidase family protein n=1 Tax=Falsiroseomonas sp. E2-1-a20 TaxID=3239300 RepID=UPI003F3091C6
MRDAHAVTSLAQLEALYGAAVPASLQKVRRDLDVPSRDFIARSPFCVLSTRGADGRVNGTPRGDAPGFVSVLSGTEVALPDRRGNNRLDALRDILGDPQVALLFLIPGVGETLRVSGRATISADPALCAAMAQQGRAPATVLLVAVEEVFFQCARALMRSRIWGETARPAGVPTAGQFLASAMQGAFDAEAYDAAAPGRLAAGLY